MDGIIYHRLMIICSVFVFVLPYDHLVAQIYFLSIKFHIFIRFYLESPFFLHAIGSLVGFCSISCYNKFCVFTELGITFQILSLGALKINLVTLNP